MRRTNDITSNSQTIKLELRNGDHYSYYIDANGILKGEWGGFNELDSVGPNGESVFEIYYDHFSQMVTINEYGLFYNIFSCKKYDGVIKPSEYVELYICEKNGRFGLIDNNEKTYLHVCYKNIRYMGDHFSLFIVETEMGEFMYNFRSKNMSEVYDKIMPDLYNYFLFKQNGKYGLLDEEGNVIIDAKYEKSLGDRSQLQVRYKNIIYGIYVKEGLLYGNISIDKICKYDLCFKAKDSFYITESGSKYGLLNEKGEIVCEPNFDEIVINKRGPERTIIWNENIDVLFVIGRMDNLYSLYNIRDGKCILWACQEMYYEKDVLGWNNVGFKKNGKSGFVTYAGIIIYNDEYDAIERVNSYYVVRKSGKYGELNSDGRQLHPCIYDVILLNKNGDIIAIKDGREEVLHPRIIRCNNDDEFDYVEYERPSYGKYSGSYAQDEAGYSDDDIDTIFDGDPDAYWNID